MAKNKYASMLMEQPSVEIISAFHPSHQTLFPLPEGADGIIYVWRTKTAARKYYGRKVHLMTVLKE